MQTFTRLLKFGAFAAWIVVVLNEFRIFRPIRDAVMGVLTHELRFGKISLTLGGVLLFLFSVWLAFWAAKTVRLILQDEILPKMSLPRGVGNSISSLTYYAMVMLGLVVALAAAGFEVSQLAFVVGALGVGIGFGLQNVVNNFVSGLILMFERPIQPGDVVEVGGHVGQGPRDRHAGHHAQHLRGRRRRGAERHAAQREAGQLDAERHGPPHRRECRRGLRHGSGQGAAAADGSDPFDGRHRAASRSPRSSSPASAPIRSTSRFVPGPTTSTTG